MHVIFSASHFGWKRDAHTRHTRTPKCIIGNCTSGDFEWNGAVLEWCCTREALCGACARAQVKSEINFACLVCAVAAAVQTYNICICAVCGWWRTKWKACAHGIYVRCHVRAPLPQHTHTYAHTRSYSHVCAAPHIVTCTARVGLINIHTPGAPKSLP